MNIAPWGNLLDTLGWTLLHSLWQLSIIAAVAALGRVALRKSSSQARYVLAYIGLVAMIAAPIATYAYLWSHQYHFIPIVPAVETIGFSNAVHYEIIDAAPHLVTTVRPRADLWQRIVEQLHAVAPFAAGGYLLGRLLLMVRLLLGYRALRQVCAGAVPALEHDTLLATLRGRLGLVQPVLLKLSPRVEVPTVIGAVRPMILLPISSLTGLSTEQLTHLLLHELAHIRRHDYVANLLQSIIETLLFYHPAVLWISAQVREEREHCCDDLAISAAGNRARYAESLATMESLRASPTLAMSAARRLAALAHSPHPASSRASFARPAHYQHHVAVAAFFDDRDCTHVVPRRLLAERGTVNDDSPCNRSRNDDALHYHRSRRRPTAPRKSATCLKSKSTS